MAAAGNGYFSRRHATTYYQFYGLHLYRLDLLRPRRNIAIIGRSSH
jgi:hypothetical protein